MQERTREVFPRFEIYSQMALYMFVKCIWFRALMLYLSIVNSDEGNEEYSGIRPWKGHICFLWLNGHVPWLPETLRNIGSYLLYL